MNPPIVIVLEGRPRRCQKTVTTLAQSVHNSCPVLVLDPLFDTFSAAPKPNQKKAGGRR